MLLQRGRILPQMRTWLKDDIEILGLMQNCLGRCCLSLRLLIVLSAATHLAGTIRRKSYTIPLFSKLFNEEEQSGYMQR